MADSQTPAPAAFAGLIRNVAGALVLGVLAVSVFTLATESPTMLEARTTGLSVPLKCAEIGEPRDVLAEVLMTASEGGDHPCLSTRLWQSFGSLGADVQASLRNEVGATVSQIATSCAQIPDCTLDNIGAVLVQEELDADGQPTTISVSGVELTVLRDAIGGIWCVDETLVVHRDCFVGTVDVELTGDGITVIDAIAAVAAQPGLEPDEDAELLTYVSGRVMADRTIQLDGQPDINDAPAGWAPSARAIALTDAGPVPIVEQVVLAEGDEMQFEVIHTPGDESAPPAGSMTVTSGELTMQLNVEAPQLFIRN